jgi:Helicase associated domain
LYKNQSTIRIMKREGHCRFGRNKILKWTLSSFLAVAIISYLASSSTVSVCAFPVSTLQSRHRPSTQTFVSTTSSFDDNFWVRNVVTDQSLPWNGFQPLKGNVAATQSWENDFSALVAYHKKHGHFIISKTSDPNLYAFCKNVRQNYKNSFHSPQGMSKAQRPTTSHHNSLTMDRIRSLEAIGFPWTPRDVTWNTKYEQLRQYFQQHGHCQLPSTTSEYKALRQWVTYQRSRYRNNETSSRMSLEQVQLLQDIEFSWTPQEERWWSQFRQLQSFVKVHGHYNIQGHEHTKLRCYKNTLRRHCREYVISVIMEGNTEGVHVSGLTPDRLHALRQKQFCWLPQTGPLMEVPPHDIFEGYQ